MKPQLVSLKEFDPKAKGQFLVHLTGAEWKNLIKNVVKEEYDPKKHQSDGGVIAIPIGSKPLRDGVVISSKVCAPGCKNNGFGRCKCKKGTLNWQLCQWDMVAGRCVGSCVGGRTCTGVMVPFRQGNFEGFRLICACR